MIDTTGSAAPHAASFIYLTPLMLQEIFLSKTSWRGDWELKRSSQASNPSRFIREEQERARVRMADSGEKPVPMTVALAAFEAPRELIKAP
ncbi:MAG TPA: hypothetical protein VF085_01040 [Solirubrobacterales bacterium]